MEEKKIMHGASLCIRPAWAYALVFPDAADKPKAMEQF
jgi:hypothetical protein